ncbi:MAG TPA: sigma-54 dependent transcriptional regulator, partial [Vicinamibacterales bacterium]|nr:sigma-54 dependent transcriptional regulator [Vicinamibacterales bacterium]
VLHGELLCARGDHEAASQIATQLASRGDLSDLQRAKVRGMLGHCAFDKGNSARGAEHLRAAIQLAARAGNATEESRLRLLLFRNQVRFLGLGEAGGDLDTLRRRVHEAGDPSIALLFHVALTELAAKLSLLPRARRHLETARSFLPLITNLSVHRQFRHTEFVLTLEEGNSAEALRLALDLAGDERVDSTTANLRTSVAHLLIMQSRFDEAEQWLQRAHAASPKGGGSELGILDTMMFLKLSRGATADAAMWDELIQQLVKKNSGLRDSSYWLWHVLTHARWLFALGRFTDGVTALRDAMPQIVRLADRRLLAKAKLLIAEGTGHSGHTAPAMSLVEEALDAPTDLTPEILAEASRIIGALAAAEDPFAGLAYYERAEQTLATLNFKALADAAATERQQTIAPDSPHPGADVVSGAVWIERLAAILTVGGHPDLLADQTRALITSTRAAMSSNVAEIEPQTARAQARRVNHIPLGRKGTKQLELRVEPALSPTSRATLMGIKRIVQSSLELANARAKEREQAALWPAKSAERRLGLICSSERMLGLIQTVQRVAPTSATVLLTGETGVGKELIASALHQASLRSERTFLPFNCSTFPREMIDSQLFGHKRGSFTGAIGDSAGVIRSAAGGTLFLDEIGEMAIETQPKLLRFLESGEILPLGETRPQSVDVRIVAATNANLDQMVAEGSFREDLFYRLNVVRIDIPPLRERREEIPALVEHFLGRFGSELQKPLLRIADETLEYLILYRWPGNVRQLANEIRRLVAMAEPGSVIMPAHLSSDIADSRRTLPVHRSPRLFDEVVTRIDQPLAAAVEHIERAAIQRALAMTDGHLDEAARILGLSRKGLYLKRQRLNLG